MSMVLLIAYSCENRFQKIVDIRFYKPPVAMNSHIHTRTRLDGEITETKQPLSAVEHTCLSFHFPSFVWIIQAVLFSCSALLHLVFVWKHNMSLSFIKI